MYQFFVALHVLLCLFLIGVILLQPGKGADAGAAFGGGMTSSVFGPRGPTSVLSQATTFVAVMFMVTSITLVLYSDPTASSGGGGLDDALNRVTQDGQTGEDKPDEVKPDTAVPEEKVPGADTAQP